MSSELAKLTFPRLSTNENKTLQRLHKFYIQIHKDQQENPNLMISKQLLILAYNYMAFRLPELAYDCFKLVDWNYVTNNWVKEIGEAIEYQLKAHDASDAGYESLSDLYMDHYEYFLISMVLITQMEKIAWINENPNFQEFLTQLHSSPFYKTHMIYHMYS